MQSQGISRFGQNQVQVLRDGDFRSNFDLLRFNSPVDLVLFYHDPFDILIPTWAEVAVTSVFPSFSSVHLLTENRVKKIIEQIFNNPNHEHYLKLKKTFDENPFIAVYRQGKFSSIYNGPMTVDELTKFSLTLLDSP